MNRQCSSKRQEINVKAKAEKNLLMEKLHKFYELENQKGREND